MRMTKVILISIAAVIVIGSLLFIIIRLYLPLVQYEKEKADYTKHTTPLSSNVVTDICLKLSLSNQDKRCQPGMIVYAPEFFDDIKGYFRNLPKEKATKEEVDRILGPYLLDCEPLTRLGNGKQYFRCLYDLRGDQATKILVYFNADNSIDYLMTSSGGS